MAILSLEWLSGRKSVTAPALWGSGGLDGLGGGGPVYNRYSIKAVCCPSSWTPFSLLT